MTRQSVDYKLAKPHHGAHLADMSKRLIEYGLPWWNWTPKRVTKAIRSPEQIALLAVIDKRIAGFGLMQFGDEQAHLNLLAVEPEYRRLGLGKGMLEWLEESCRIAGIIRIDLECRANNVSTIRFYSALGFDACSESRNYYCGRESAIRMQKQLSALNFVQQD